MSESSSPSNVAGEVAIQLLDSSSGRTIKTWTFIGRAQITIGRSPDRDVEMSDPYVSRNHANLEFREGQWHLISLGRNGVVVANQLVTEYPVTGDVNFRLGMEGPTLRFRTTTEKAAEILSTICFDTLPAPMFELDGTKVQKDVDAIVDRDYFQQLQQRAKQMRRQRDAD
jgi:pSer/pThr/pTyr-binding forkhead associated (FHA) protein